MPLTNEPSPLPSLAERDHIRCASCALNKLCLPGGLDEAGTERLNAMITHRRVLRDEQLFCMDQPFVNIYAVRAGHFKNFHVNRHGERQILRFPMASDILGLDAIGTARHASCAVALENSEVCAIPFSQFELLSADLPQLQRHFNGVLGQQIARDQSAMLVMGKMRAEQKFAVFLLALSARYAALGYSPLRFRLRMSREEIGNYLGLTVESVSRLMLRFKQKDLLRIANRDVAIAGRAEMEALATGLTPSDPIASRSPRPRLIPASRLSRVAD